MTDQITAGLPELTVELPLGPSGATAYVIALLRKHGCAIVHNAFTPMTVESLKREADQALTDLDGYAYPFGRQARLPLEHDDGRFLATLSALQTGFVKHVCEAYGARPENDFLVWSEETAPDATAIYGIPHFDRRHQLKVFVYLSDVGLSDGPTHVAPESREERERRWAAAWRDALELPDQPDDALRPAISAVPDGAAPYRRVACTLERPRRDFIPVIGSAGTMVFFDTCVPHFGGLVAEDGFRRTVRRHCILA